MRAATRQALILFVEPQLGCELRVGIGSALSGQDVPGHLLMLLTPVVSSGHDMPHA